MNTEAKCGAESKGKTIQRLPYLVIHPIYSYKTQRVLLMHTSTCCPESDIAFIWEDLLAHDKYSQSATELSTASPMRALEMGCKEPKDFATP